jgi:hypothetical protein
MRLRYRSLGYSADIDVEWEQHFRSWAGFALEISVSLLIIFQGFYGIPFNNPLSGSAMDCLIDRWSAKEEEE